MTKQTDKPKTTDQNAQKYADQHEADTRYEYERVLASLPGLGYFEGDIDSHLEQSAKSNIQDIVDIMAEQYRAKTGIKTLPSSLWKLLWKRAHHICGRHCAKLARELEEEARKP